MVQSRRTSIPGERLDNAHPRSYLRFASSAYEFITGDFLPAVIQAAPRFAKELHPPSPILAVAYGFASAFRHGHQLKARKRIIEACPSLTREQLQPLAELYASIEVELAAALNENGIGGSPPPLPSTSDPYFASRQTVAMLVGAAWINLPAELREASSGRAIAERFEDGIPTGEKTDFRNQVRRGRMLFLDCVARAALREGLSTPDGLPRLYSFPANLERALHAIWADPAMRRSAARDGDAVETVRHLASTGDLYVLVWEALQKTRPPRNRAAIKRIAEVRSDVLDAQRSAIRARIAALDNEQSTADAPAERRRRVGGD